MVMIQEFSYKLPINWLLISIKEIQQNKSVM